MSDSFEPKDEWVEICDAEGNKAEMHHLATIREGDKTYFVLGTPETDEREGGFLLVREERTGDGAQEYVVACDENEIDRIVGRFVMNAIMEEMGEHLDEEDGDECEICGMAHGPLEMCVCGEERYLQ